MPNVISWNVNGVRSATEKGLGEWFAKLKPDFLCLQETKAQLEQVDLPRLTPKGYGSLWRSARKKGYSGVAVFFREEPLEAYGLGVEAFDAEGRVLALEYKEFVLVNAYFPNSQPERARLDYKLDFCAAMLDFLQDLRSKGKNIVLCGDYNIAHTEIDLARPKDNENSAGFYIEERQAMTRFLTAGYTDTFRLFTKEGGHYTWWSYRAGARERNVGWRIDYHCVNREFAPRVTASLIHPDVMGSDHCPVELRFRG